LEATKVENSPPSSATNPTASPDRRTDPAGATDRPHVLLIYVYLLANAFLVGIQLDANVRERA
jgi:hypothetical protein